MEKNTKKATLDSVVIGAALFAMFFGAGNMIFPPYLGLQAGREWLTAFLGYYIADIGLALVAMFTLIRVQGREPILRPPLSCALARLSVFPVPPLLLMNYPLFPCSKNLICRCFLSCFSHWC